MKRFATVQEWNKDIAEDIRNAFMGKYKVDLSKYIPESAADFMDKWEAVEKSAFGEVELICDFSAEGISNMLSNILMYGSKGDIIFNAVNRYELYEPDVWISAGYTIRYLEAAKWSREVNWTKLLNRKETDNVSDEIAQMLKMDAGEDIFAYKFLKYLINEKRGDLFSFIFKEEASGKVNLYPTEDEDVTRWSWQKILMTERDIFRSGIVTEKEFREGMKKVKISTKSRPSVKTAEIQKFMLKSPKLEDYVLYLRLTNGELVRRILRWCSEYWNGKFSLLYLNDLCRIEPFFWKVVLAEIKTQLYTKKSEVCGFAFEHENLVDYGSKYTDNLRRLLNWVANSLKAGDIINENMKLMTKGMVYLYMALNEDRKLEVLDIIQKNAIYLLDTINTPKLHEFKKVINDYIKQTGTNMEEKNLESEEESARKDDYAMIEEDNMTMKMLDDLLERKKNRSNGKSVHHLDGLPTKIKLQVKEETLTAQYVRLQRLVILLLAVNYNLRSND